MTVLTFRGTIRLTAIDAEVFCIPNKNPDSSTSFHPYIFCWHLNRTPPANVVMFSVILGHWCISFGNMSTQVFCLGFNPFLFCPET